MSDYSRDLESEAKTHLSTLETQLNDLEKLLPVNTPERLSEALVLWNSIYDFVGFSTLDSALEHAILNQPETPAAVDRLRKGLVAVEAALEISTADKMDLAKDPGEALQILQKGVHNIFYQLMCPVEWGALLTVLGKPPQSVAILGSGSLPETGIWILDWARRTGNKVHICNTDLLTERVERSKRVYSSLDLLDDVSFASGDARTAPADLSTFDAVYFNLTVGRTSEEKEDILMDVVSRMRPGAVVLTRSTYSLKTMAFPAVSIQTPRVLSKLRPVLQCHSNGQKYSSINASVILSKVI